MTLLAEQTSLTAEEFLSLPNQRDYELIDGQLVERKHMGAKGNLVAAELIRVLANFCKKHQAGWVFPSDTTYQCFRSPLTFRRPDVSFIRRERLPDVPEGQIKIPPDLAIEIVSPSNSANEIEEKVEQYLAADFPLLWVVYPNTRSIRVHRADGSITGLHEGDMLSGESVLPGFSLPVRDLFAAPIGQ